MDSVDVFVEIAAGLARLAPGRIQARLPACRGDTPGDEINGDEDDANGLEARPT